MSRPTGDRGSGTVLVLGFVAVLVLAGMTATALAAVGVARHRAANAADLAALAAAARSTSGAAAACDAATRSAAASGARVLSCALSGSVAAVVVVVRPPGWLGTVGAVTSRARAGPVQLAG